MAATPGNHSDAWFSVNTGGNTRLDVTSADSIRVRVAGANLTGDNSYINASPAYVPLIHQPATTALISYNFRGKGRAQGSAYPLLGKGTSIIISEF